MNKTYLAVVLLSSSLLAHKEVVREIARSVERSEVACAKAHLERLQRFNLPKAEHKQIIKDLQDTARQIRENFENKQTISASWIDSFITFGGSALVVYGLNSLLSARKIIRKANKRRRYSNFNGQQMLRNDDPRQNQAPRSTFSLTQALWGLSNVAVGGYAAYKGYKCWYQQRCLEAAKKMEECLEDALLEVKEG